MTDNPENNKPEFADSAYVLPQEEILTHSQRRRKNIYVGGVKAGLTVAINEMKKELPKKYHSRLNKLRQDLGSHPDLAFTISTAGKNMKGGSLNHKSYGNQRNEDEPHPMDFDPEAHRRRYNYDSGWNDDDW